MWRLSLNFVEFRKYGALQNSSDSAPQNGHSHVNVEGALERDMGFPRYFTLSIENNYLQAKERSR